MGFFKLSAIARHTTVGQSPVMPSLQEVVESDFPQYGPGPAVFAYFDPSLIDFSISKFRMMILPY